MKKNYFFKEIVQGGIPENFSIRFLLLLLFALVNLTHSLHASTRDSANVNEQDDGVIYVTDNAFIALDSLNTKAKIVYISSADASVNSSTQQKSPSKKVAALKEKSEQLKTKARHLPKKIDISVDEIFSSAPIDNFYSNPSTRQICTITPTSNYFSFQDAILAEVVLLPKILYKKQLAKQKYYTSLSYLQFGKFRSSSLRAPPHC